MIPTHHIHKLRCLLVALVASCTAVVAHAASLRIEAELFRVHLGGGAKDGHWSFYKNGQAGECVEVSQSGRYHIIFWGHGSAVNGVGCQIAAIVDKKTVESLYIDDAPGREYRLDIDLAAGLHTIELAFVNNASLGAEDRNAHIDAMEIRSADPTARIALADVEVWKKAWGERTDAEEVSLLREADASIERIRKGDKIIAFVDVAGQPLANASVRIKLVNHSFLFGGNIYRFDRYTQARDNRLYKKRFRELFNFATVPFYWRPYEPEEGKPGYPYTDSIVAWCNENNIAMKGHPLLWDHPAGVPKWSTGQPDRARQESRVREIMTRYAGIITYWEVVNEPAHTSAVPVDEPYRWARETDPTAHLSVNDYEVMATGFPPFYELLEKAIADGLPFDGIGIQAHEPRAMRFPLPRIKEVLDKYATLKKALYITEFTPTSSGKPIEGAHFEGNWDEAAQREYAVKFYIMCFAHPAVHGITWWDLSDDGAWLPGGGLLRDDLSPKPAYTALHDLIRVHWNTDIRARSDAGGRLAFRGFHGQYEVSVKRNGRTKKQIVDLSPGVKSPISVIFD